MDNQLQKVYNALEAQRESLLVPLHQLSPERFSQAPAPGKWSLSQVLTHIITSEKLSVGYMKKKSQGIDQLRNSGIPERLRLWMLILSQRIPVKYKAPKMVVESTPQALSLAEVRNQWNAVREELSSFLNGIEAKNVRKVVYKHPIAGRLDARQAMIFFREHINHHKPQIERLLKNPGK